MLQSLRQHATSWVVKILFALLILSFGLWGINDIFLGERDPAVATVGGTKIPTSQLSEALRQEMERFQPIFGGALDTQQAKQLGILDQALERLIDRAVFGLAADDIGVVASDDMIRRHIQNEPAFRNALGQFDRSQFQQVLLSNNLTEERYVGLLRRDLATRQIAGAVGGPAPVPDGLMQPLHRFRGESRVADLIDVPASGAPTPPPPDEATLAEYYKANSERFTAPEYRTASYVALDPEKLAEEIAIDDERLRREYRSREADYVLRERRDVDQAVIRDEAEAQRVHALMQQGQTLEAALKAAESKAEVIKLGWVERPDLIPEIAAPTFALSAGQHSAPLKSALGWHIVRVNDAEAARTRGFDEVRDELRRDLAAREAAEAAYQLSIKVEDALAGGASLEEAAAQAGLKVAKVPPVDANGLTMEGKAAPTLPPDPVFIRTLFATPEGRESSPLDLAGGTLAILQVDKVIPPAVKPLETVRTELIAAWQDERRRAATRARAQAIADKIKAGQPAAEVAAAEKLTVRASAPFSRVAPEAGGLPDAVRSQLFGAAVGDVVVGDSRDGAVVVVLREIRPAPPLADAARDQLTEQLSAAIGGDLLDQFAAALRQRYEVEIDRAAIDRRF